MKNNPVFKQFSFGLYFLMPEMLQMLHFIGTDLIQNKDIPENIYV